MYLKSCFSLAIALVTLMVFWLPVAMAQEGAREPQDDLLLARLHKSSQGKVIAAGKNTAGPTEAGPFSVTDYTVDELGLEKAVRVKINGKQVTTSKAYRITLKGGPFQVRAMPATLHIDGKLVGLGVESPNLDSITFVTFDRSLLDEGATIKFGYGGGPASVELSDKLRLTNPK